MKRIILIAVAAFAFCGLSFGQQLQELPNDPAVRKGKLDNGMTYYIRHNDQPAGRAEFYLATDVGAIQETPDQDGLAHFLEHMCFNGTKNFPGKGILDWLQSIGASFGGNVNASTGVEHTQYMLNNIPLVRETVVDTCLLIMHDYSHFVTNDPKEIDAERGVIIEERRSRRNAQWRLYERSLPYIYGDTKYGKCTLIGSQENLETFKPESLHNFYKTWYRPDLQAVIVVGDVDVDSVEGKIKKIFADIPAAQNPQAKEVIPIPGHKDPVVAVLTDPEATSSSFELIWHSDAMPNQFNSTIIGATTDVLKDLVASIMSERFNDITAKADAPFIGASFGIDEMCETMEVAVGNVVCKNDAVLPGLETLLTELEKMKRYGFTDSEVSRAKDDILAYYEKAAKGASTRKNPEFIRPLIMNFFDNYSYMDPQVEYELVQQICSQITPAILNQTVAGVITDENLVILYNGPEKEGAPTPSQEQILSVLNAVKSADIQANAEEAVNEPLLDPSSLKGSPVTKTETGLYNSTVWTLKNGIKAVVLPTEYKKDQILVRLFKPGGLSLVPTEDMPSFENSILGLFLRNSGVSKFKNTTLTKMLSGKNVSMSQSIGRLYSELSGSSSVKDLETEMQLLYLSFVDPRFDQEEYDQGIAQIKTLLPNLMGQPDYRLQKEVNKTLYSSNPRIPVLSPEVLEKANLQTIERNYRKLFNDAAGAVLVIVGDVDLETLKPLVEKYAGSIPKGKKATAWVDNHEDIAKGKIVNVFEEKMETPMTTVLQLITEYRPYSVEEEVNRSAVKYVLDMIYTQTLREDEGGTYGASVMDDARMSPYPMFLMQTAFQAKPSMADKLRELAVAGFRRLAEEGPTEEEFARTVENFKKMIPERRINNSYWLENLVTWQKDGIDSDKDWETAVGKLSADAVKAAAKSMLDTGNFIEIVMKPGETSEKE